MSSPADQRNSSQEIIDRLQASAALLESLKRKRVPPTIKRDSPELLFGKFWVEITIIENGERRWEFFNDSTLLGLGAKVAAREKDLLA
jgi:hypothetical protein